MPSRICPSLSLSLCLQSLVCFGLLGVGQGVVRAAACAGVQLWVGLCVCVRAQRPVGPRVSVKLHLHVLEIVEDCRRLLHPLSGGSQHQPTKSLTVWC